jgi:hypothetical protein
MAHHSHEDPGITGKRGKRIDVPQILNAKGPFKSKRT